MQFTSYLAIFSIGLLAPLAAATPADVQARACSCTHNSDAGRWVDHRDPYGAVSEIAVHDDGSKSCLTADKQGIMCLSGDKNQHQCMKDFVQGAQSYHGDWFIWTRVNCGGMEMTVQAN